MLLHALYERLCTAPLNRLPCYGALEVIVTLLLLLLYYEVVRASAASFTRLQSLHKVTLKSHLEKSQVLYCILLLFKVLIDKYNKKILKSNIDLLIYYSISCKLHLRITVGRFCR